LAFFGYGKSKIDFWDQSESRFLIFFGLEKDKCKH